MNPAIAVGIGVFLFLLGLLMGGIFERRLQRHSPIPERIRDVFARNPSLRAVRFVVRHGKLYEGDVIGRELWDRLGRPEPPYLVGAEPYEDER